MDSGNFTAIFWSAQLYLDGWDGWDGYWTVLKSSYLLICSYLIIFAAENDPVSEPPSVKAGTWVFNYLEKPRGRRLNAWGSKTCQDLSFFPTKTISWHWHFLRTHSSFFLGVPGYLGLTLNETTDLFLLSRRLFFLGWQASFDPHPRDQDAQLDVSRAINRNGGATGMCARHAQGHKYKIWGHIHTEILLLRYI